MKTITLYINDDVYRDIKNEVFLKRLVQAGYGPGDSLLLKLIDGKLFINGHPFNPTLLAV